MGGFRYFIMTGGYRIPHGGDRGKDCCWRWTVLILAIVSAVCFLITIIVLSFTYPKEGPKAELTLGLSETRIVSIRSHWYSTFEGGPVTVIDRTPGQESNYTSNDTLVELLKFTRKPPLTIVDTWNSTISATIGPADYYYWSWFFYADSSIDINWNFTSSVRTQTFVYFIKSQDGYDAFNEWVAERDSSLIAPYILFSGSEMSHLTYTAEADDLYYVFFWNSHSSTEQSGSFSFQASSKILDVSNPSSSCYLPCSMSVPFSSDDILVVVSPHANSFSGIGSINTNFGIATYTYSREWFVALYFLAFGAGLAVSLGIVIAMVYLIHVRRHVTVQTHPNVANVETPRSP